MLEKRADEREIREKVLTAWGICARDPSLWNLGFEGGLKQSLLGAVAEIWVAESESAVFGIQYEGIRTLRKLARLHRNNSAESPLARHGT